MTQRRPKAKLDDHAPGFVAITYQQVAQDVSLRQSTCMVRRVSPDLPQRPRGRRLDVILGLRHQSLALRRGGHTEQQKACRDSVLGPKKDSGYGTKEGWMTTPLPFPESSAMPTALAPEVVSHWPSLGRGASWALSGRGKRVLLPYERT